MASNFSSLRFNFRFSAYHPDEKGRLVPEIPMPWTL